MTKIKQTFTFIKSEIHQHLNTDIYYFKNNQTNRAFGIYAGKTAWTFSGTGPGMPDKKTFNKLVNKWFTKEGLELKEITV